LTHPGLHHTKRVGWLFKSTIIAAIHCIIATIPCVWRATPPCNINKKGQLLDLESLPSNPRCCCWVQSGVSLRTIYAHGRHGLIYFGKVRARPLGLCSLPAVSHRHDSLHAVTNLESKWVFMPTCYPHMLNTTHRGERSCNTFLVLRKHQALLLFSCM
jgi:hypothetical protein